ncbi:hypothetical protein FEK35_16975 [Nocardia cyriacigeorgica]|uniref:Uncharacterized protein n=1 Tax=Nocardia cyriacigeorgica TaxID=135487 RepID=A0A5R8PBL9_9NOCA|nr:hypothetical protein FEK35_16975 [Nocardia cyriacigeorgica]
MRTARLACLDSGMRAVRHPHTVGEPVGVLVELIADIADSEVDLHRGVQVDTVRTDTEVDAQLGAEEDPEIVAVADTVERVARTRRTCLRLGHGRGARQAEGIGARRDEAIGAWQSETVPGLAEPVPGQTEALAAGLCHLAPAGAGQRETVRLPTGTGDAADTGHAFGGRAGQATETGDALTGGTGDAAEPGDTVTAGTGDATDTGHALAVRAGYAHAVGTIAGQRRQAEARIGSAAVAHATTADTAVQTGQRHGDPRVCAGVLGSLIGDRGLGVVARNGIREGEHRARHIGIGVAVARPAGIPAVQVVFVAARLSRNATTVGGHQCAAGDVCAAPSYPRDTTRYTVGSVAATLVGIEIAVEGQVTRHTTTPLSGLPASSPRRTDRE